MVVVVCNNVVRWVGALISCLAKFLIMSVCPSPGLTGYPGAIKVPSTEDLLAAKELLEAVRFEVAAVACG